MEKEYNGWKVPTPVEINNEQSLTFLDRAVFREILSLCKNRDKLLRFMHNEKHCSIKLKKGQCIFKVSKVADELEIGRKRVRRSIDIISDWYSPMDSEATPFGLLLTLKDYDKIIKMDNEMDNDGTVKGQWRDSEGTSTKSAKNEESEKKKPVRDYELEIQKIVERWNKVEVDKWKKIRIVTPSLLAVYKKTFKGLRAEKITELLTIAINNYIQEVESRTSDTPERYLTHRHSFYTFLEQKNGYMKFINF